MSWSHFLENDLFIFLILSILYKFKRLLIVYLDVCYIFQKCKDPNIGNPKNCANNVPNMLPEFLICLRACYLFTKINKQIRVKTLKSNFRVFLSHNILSLPFIQFYLFHTHGNRNSSKLTLNQGKFTSSLFGVIQRL